MLGNGFLVFFPWAHPLHIPSLWICISGIPLTTLLTVKSVNFPPFLVYFLQFWFIFQSISVKFLILTFSFAFLRNSMCDLIGFEPDLLGFIWFFFVFIFWKGLKEDHIFKGWFTNMFRDHLNLFSKPSNFQNLRQIGKKLQNCGNLA